jgi:hypothetical protein
MGEERAVVLDGEDGLERLLGQFTAADRDAVRQPLAIAPPLTPTNFTWPT